ncbi:DUF805 domain-containing protein [Thalassospira sp. TSL5-1]|uniref:DUF805 domain-containing protein n=1 Tax=Thalassospira sp. TSL5-1 TaxID=1544451 RepID=UPI00093DF0CA|nr:DUF805 domain-containing protein [Thalassospira sp. TSL5-1]OKH87094.1 hypothetical protein LF95_19080 [Thalassospira sp. TSL5-1]
MNFGEAISSGFRNYFNFRDRSSRSAFWWWQLFALVCAIVLSVVDSEFLGWPNGGGPLNSVFNLVVFFPTLALGVRRLHDTDRSGWWMLLVMLPLIGIIVLIVWWCKPTQLGPNRFGPMPVDFYRQPARGEPEF